MAVSVCVLVFTPKPAPAQVIRPVRQFSTEGTIKAIRSGRILVTDGTGKSWQMQIAARQDGRVALSGSGIFLAPPPNIEIEGELQPSALDRGSRVRFDGFADDKGNLTAPVSSLVWADEAGFQPGVKVNRQKTDESGNVACVVSGTFESINKDKLTIRLPRSRYASKGKMLVRLAEGATVKVKSRDLSKVQAGDRVAKVSGVELNTGDLVIQQLKIRLVDDVESTKVSKQEKKATGQAAPVDSKYRKLSDEKVAPRLVRSQHYVVHTDLSDRDARVLVDRLEEMLGIITRYYGRPQPAPVECFVVSDLKSWQTALIPEDAQKKIANKEGITKMQSIVSSVGRQSAARVYACDDAGVVQHEAVHAYCHLAFGSTGPLWYAEGMAEMGQYWKVGQRAVEIDERVVRYLKKAKPRKTLKEVVAPGPITGDAWKEYAWRWALCYLLANNPNYNRRFKDLGMELMMQRPGASLAKYYGGVAQQLMFEYDQFTKDIENGYRADLCAWRWKHKFEPVDKQGQKTVQVLAKAGWQPGVRVEEGIEYDYVAKGEWQIDGSGTKCTADGDSAGVGKLKAVVMKNFQLSEVIALGTTGKFRAPATGDLYLRCGEVWSRLGDNSGGLTVHLRLAE